jgi:NTP pyrophosphatase (non-canonical NTP hydrolase)
MNKLAQEIIEINKSKGWNVTKRSDWDDSEYKILAVMQLITTEVAEASEAFRINDFENFKEELADVIIRTLDCCGGMGIDIEAEIAKKLEKNRLRPYKHGGKRV